MMYNIFTFILLGLLASVNGGPLTSFWRTNDKCATKCIGSQKFKYIPGTTYHFAYVTNTITGMEDASEDSASISVAATANVHVLSECDMVLQLSNIQAESNSEAHSKADVTDPAHVAHLQLPLRFSFQDGEIDNICPSNGDELWSLNIKRGFLSAFQTSMKRLDTPEMVTETDVTGKCPSNYSVQSNGWYSTTIRREKDLMACTDRHGYGTSLQTSAYDTQTSAQSVPLMKSSHSCEQTVDKSGFLKSANCEERHLFRPFSREGSGAMTKVSQNIQYLTTSHNPINYQPVYERSGLTFEHAKNEQSQTKGREVVEKVLQELCRNTDTDVRPETPRFFSSLVSAMRKLETIDLRTLYDSLERNKLCAKNARTKKFFMDALPMVSTDSSVILMMEMLNKNDISGIELKVWMTSLAFIPNPSEVMLDRVTSLLTSETLYSAAALPVSTMVNKFCASRDNCNSHYSVQAIMDVFDKNIGSSCYISNKNIDKVILALRAIGNAGHMSRGIHLINMCMSRNRNPIEVRVAATEAYRRMPCDDNRDVPMSLYENTQEDSELRISAYIASMTCPNDVILHHVLRQLDSETDQQVGSFVWSHLSNLRETSNPHYQGVRALLKKEKLDDKFDLGKLQHSRNYEGSTFLNRLSSGGSAESNLIWSSTSSIPRSASANLTVDLFGNSLNLIDVGMRIEGFENIMEKALGPYGYFGQNEDYKGKQLDALKGSIYMRMMGNEMAFNRFQGLQSLSAPFNLLDLLTKVNKDEQLSLTQSLEFLDTEMTIPTSSGFPLSLKVQGTASVDVQASGRLDLHKLSSSPRSLLIDGEIRPSGAVNVAGTMSVDSKMSRAALRMTGTLHSSTVFKARVNVDRGSVLSVQLDMPRDKMEILDIRSEFSIIHNEVEKKQSMITENRKSFELCTGNVAARIFGLELCGELKYPNATTVSTGPYYPLTGPTSLSLFLYKRDTHSGYTLLAKKVENPQKLEAQISFNTPGSRVNRAMAFDLVLDNVNHQMEVSAATPWKKLDFKGSITATKELMGVKGSFVTDDTNIYAVTSEVKREQISGGVVYIPLIEIRTPSRDDISLSGHVTSLIGKSVSADLTLAGLSLQPLSLKSAVKMSNKEIGAMGSVGFGDIDLYVFRTGSIINIKETKMEVEPYLFVKTPSRTLADVSSIFMYSKSRVAKASVVVKLLDYKTTSADVTLGISGGGTSSRYQAIANVKSSLFSAKLDSLVIVKNSRLANTRTSIFYSSPILGSDNVILLAKMSDRSMPSYNKYSLRSSLDFAKNPEYNVALNLNIDHKKKLSSGELEIKYGSDPSDSTKRILLSGSVVRKIRSPTNMNVVYQLQTTAPRQNIDFKLEGKHSQYPGNLDSNVAMSLGKGKDVKAGITFNDRSDRLQKMIGSLKFASPIGGLDIGTDFIQTSQKQWEHNVDVNLSNGARHQLSTVYGSPSDMAKEVTSTLSLYAMDPITVSAQSDMDSSNLLLATYVQNGEKVYGIRGSKKSTKPNSHNLAVDVTVPSRRMTLTASTDISKDKYQGSVEAAWNADREKESKIIVEGMAASRSGMESSSHKAHVSIKSPIRGYENVIASVTLDNGPRQYQVSSKFLLGGNNALTASMVANKPVTFSNIDFTLKAQTPFHGFQSMEASLVHKINAGINTKIFASLERRTCHAVFSILNRGTNVYSDMQTQLEVVSTLGMTGEMSLSGRVQDDGRHFTSHLDIMVNRRKYGSMINVLRTVGSINGDYLLTWPGHEVNTTLDIQYTKGSVMAKATSMWDHDKKIMINFDGKYASGSISGSTNLRTPWGIARDWQAETRNTYHFGKFASSTSVKKLGRDIYTQELKASIDSAHVNFDYSMTTPWTEPIVCKLKSHYKSYPVTVATEVSWSSSKKITIDGSVNVNKWNDFDINIRLTTPMANMHTLATQLSSKVEGSDVVSQIILDMGMRNNAMMVSRLRRDYRGIRVTVSSPWEKLREVDTGVLITHGDVHADFNMIPGIGKYEAVATWTYNADLDAKIKLITPREDFPYFQMVISSKKQRSISTLRFELDCASGQVYSLEASYTFSTPLVLDISIATPLEGYETMSANLRYNHKGTAADGSVQIVYGKNYTAIIDAKVDWSRGGECNVVINTPFTGWEENSITLHHVGSLNQFSSLAEMTLGGRQVSVHARVLNMEEKELLLTMTTPWESYEKMEVDLNLKGDWSDMRSSMLMTIGQDRIEGIVQNKWTSANFHVMTSFNSPWTEEMKFHLEKAGSNQVEARANIGRSYFMNADIKIYNDRRQMNALGNLNYRYGSMQKTLTASATQSGSLRDMSFSATASVDNEKMSMNAEFSTLHNLKASASIQTPFAGYEYLGIDLLGTGNLLRMGTEVNVNLGAGKTIEVKIKWDVENGKQLSFEGSLTSSLPGMERTSVMLSNFISSTTYSGALSIESSVKNFGELKASYQLAGALSNMKGKMQTTHNGNIVMYADFLNKRSFNGLQSSMHLRAIFMPEISAEVNYRGDHNRFSTSVQASMDRNKISSETSWSMSNDKINLDQVMHYLINGRSSHMEIILAEIGNMDDVTVQIRGNFSNVTLSLMGKLRIQNSLEATMDIELPMENYRHVGASVSASNDLNGLSVSATVSRNTDKIEIVGKYENSERIVGSVEIKTPFVGFKEVSSGFSLRRNIADVYAKLQDKKIEATGQYKSDKPMEGSITIHTPFSGYDYMGVSAKVNDEKALISANIMNQKIEAKGSFVYSDALKCSVEISTPFSEYKEFGASLNIDSQSTKLSANFMDSRVEASGRWAYGETFMASVHASTPFSGYKDIGASFIMEKDRMNASVELMGKKMEAYGTFTDSGSLGASLNIQIPLSGFNRMRGSSVSKEKIQITGRYVKSDAIRGMIDITTPFTNFEHFSTSFDVNKNTINASVIFMEKQINITGKLSYSNSIEGIINIITPFNGFSHMTGSFKLDSSMPTFTANIDSQQFQCTMDISRDSGKFFMTTPIKGYKHIGGQYTYATGTKHMSFMVTGFVEEKQFEINVKYSALADIITSISVSTPLIGFRTLGSSLVISRKGNGFTSHAEAHVESEKIDINADYVNADTLSARFGVNTPFRNYKTFGATFKMTKDLHDFSSDLTANLLNDRLVILTKLNTIDTIAGSIDISTPFDGFFNVGGSFQASSPGNQLRSEARLTYMDRKTFGYKVRFSNKGARDIDMKAEIVTPFKDWETTKLTYRHGGWLKNFQCAAMLVRNNEEDHSLTLKVNLENDNQLEFSLKTPYESLRSTSFSHTLSSTDTGLQWLGDVAFGDSGRLSAQLSLSNPRYLHYSALFELRTPLTSDLVLSLDHQGHFNSMVHKESIKYGDLYHVTNEIQSTINSELWMIQHSFAFTMNDVYKAYSWMVRREGQWNDYTIAAKADLNNLLFGSELAFRNEPGNFRSEFKLTTPIENLNDIGVSAHYVGSLGRAFNSVLKIEYADDEITGKLDYACISWKDFSLKSQLRSPWGNTEAQYKHTVDDYNVLGVIDLVVPWERRISGDFRLVTSPRHEISMTIMTPITAWEKLSASGGYQNDDWGREISGMVDLGAGQLYSFDSTLSGTASTGRTVNVRLTTPLHDWKTIEARISHEGELLDSTSSLFFSVPLLSAISASSRLRYQSPFDLNTILRLDTPLEHVKDLKLEIINGDHDTKKTSHVLLGWAVDKEIVFDGSWRHDNSWYERHLLADIGIISPFEKMKSANLVIGHDSTNNNYIQKISGNLNGDKVIDLDFSTKTGDIPSMTLTLREPAAMLYSAAGIAEGVVVDINWDRNNPNRSLQLISRMVDSSYASTTKHEVDLKVIHSSRTLGVSYNAMSDAVSMTSKGELFWGRGASRRMSYVIDLTDRSRFTSKVLEGNVKINLMSRALQLTGSVSRSASERQMDATLYWDADRDEKKQVAMSTAWSVGERSKAIVYFSLPFLDKEVRIHSDVVLLQGETLMDSSISLSYSTDASKRLTFTSSLKDNTRSWDRGINYTLDFSLTHPYTDLDLTVISSIGASDDFYSAGVESWYMTSQRQMKNLALRGEIDRLRNLINVEMVSPMKSVSVSGKINSVRPLSIGLLSRVDESVLRTDLTLDRGERSLTLKTSYDRDYPERTLVFIAHFVNNTALKAEVYRDHVLEMSTDAIITLRLNTSTLLHSRLFWRPSAVNELQEYLLATLEQVNHDVQADTQVINDAIRSELNARYSRSTTAIVEELSPIVDKLEAEFAQVTTELYNLQRQLSRFYRRYAQVQALDQYVKQKVATMQTYLRHLTDIYSRTLAGISHTIRDTIQCLATVSVGDIYHQLSEEVLSHVKEILDSGVRHMSGVIGSLDNYLEEVYKMGVKISNTVTDIAFHPNVIYLKEAINVTPYVKKAYEKLSEFRLPERYNDALHLTSKMASDALSKAMDVGALKLIKTTANNIYQEVVWAFNYWEVEKNLKEHLKNIAILIKEIVLDELRPYTKSDVLSDSRVTVWNPEHGEIQAEVRLPFAMESFTSLPEFTTLIDDYKDVVDAYVPDMDTLQDIYHNYAPRFSIAANLTNGTVPVRDLSRVKPVVLLPMTASRESNRNVYNSNFPFIASF